MIIETSNSFFGRVKGIVIDNAYEIYSLNRFVIYYKEKKINFLQVQDNDLSFLKYFNDVQFLSIPQDAENFDSLNNFKKLVGLSVFSSVIKKIKTEVLEKIKFLEIIFDDIVGIDFTLFKSLLKLRIVDYPDREIKIVQHLENLEFENCKKISTLNFLSEVTSLKNIKLEFLPRLENISVLKIVGKKIESLTISNCKKIQDIEENLSQLTNLKKLKILTESTDSKMVLKSLAFLKNQPRLEEFSTNYRIKDGDLTKLLVLKNANITAFYKNYNLKDKDLPHIEVIIKENGKIRAVNLSTLQLGKEDKRIMWLD